MLKIKDFQRQILSIFLQGDKFKEEMESFFQGKHLKVLVL